MWSGVSVYIVVSALVCLCVYLWYIARKTVDWSSLGVPVLPSTFLRGSLSFLFKDNPARWLIQCQHQYPGAPLVGATLPWRRPALLICCPDAAAEAFKPGVCKERNLSGGHYDPAGSLNIFTVKEPLWTLLRRQVSPMLTAGRVRAANGLVRNRVRRLTKRIDEELAKGTDFNLREILTDYTTDIISVAALGIESDSLQGGDSIVRDVTREMVKYDWVRSVTWSSIFFFPKFLNIIRTPMFPKRAVKLIELALKSGERTRPVENKHDYKAQGMNDMLMNIQLPEEYADILEDARVAQAMILIEGGFGTTASTMCFCLLELAHNPDIQDLLYRELNEASKSVGGDLDSTTLAELPLLNAVIKGNMSDKETLRLYPGMGWLDRMTTQPTEIAGVPIPAGIPLLINMAGMQRDPLYFENPEKYDPMRFLPENEDKIHPYSFLPFGHGSKGCVGFRFGQQTLQFGLSGIILNYTLSPGAGCPLPKDFLWEKKSTFLLPGEPLNLKLTPRKK